MKLNSSSTVSHHTIFFLAKCKRSRNCARAAVISLRTGYDTHRKMNPGSTAAHITVPCTETEHDGYTYFPNTSSAAGKLWHIPCVLLLLLQCRLSGFIHGCCNLLAGEALLETNTIVDYIYSSPSLRCVQTAHNILKGKNPMSRKGCILLTFWGKQCQI